MIVKQHPQNTQRPSQPKKKVIDGIPTSVNGQYINPYSMCGSTNQGDNPWVRIVMKKSYLVSLVRVIIYGNTGQSVAVRVGNSLRNKGNNNYLCGNVPYNGTGSENRKATWRDIFCLPSQWGRYINFDRTVRYHNLEICEVAFKYGQ